MADYGAPWRDSSPPDFRTPEEAVKAAYEREQFLRTAMESPPDQPTPDEFREELDAIYKLHAAKRSDYTGDGADKLANYRFASSMVGLDAQQGMFMRMCEKVFRIYSVNSKGGSLAVADEPLTQDLRDIAILAILMILDKRGGEYSAPKDSV